MPTQVVPIQGLDTVGVVQDIPPVALPPNAFSDARNVRFRDGAARKMQGEVNILPYVNYGPNDTLRYIAWWPNPNLAVNNSGYYLVILQQVNETSNEFEDNAYLIQVAEAGRIDQYITLQKTIDGVSPPDMIGDDGTPGANWTPQYKGTFDARGEWQHTFFQGGFSLIVNNGLEAPRFILDSEDNRTTENVMGFQRLPGWDSYAVVPDPANPDQTVTVATVTAGVIRSFGSFLVAGNLVERAEPVNGAPPEVIRGLPGVIRSSDVAAPGNIPQNWNPFATGVSTADEFTITNDGVVQDLVELQGNLFIYSNSSIAVMSNTGNQAIPLTVRPVTDVYGAITTDAVLEFDGRHIVVGSQDIYSFGGHPGSIKSIADTKIRREFFNRLNPLAIGLTFLLQYQQRDEIWICYANESAISDKINEALIWNYRNNTWTYRDLVDVVSGDVGPVPGGGLPAGEITLTGNSGDNYITTQGNAHVNTILYNRGAIEVEGEGREHKCSITIDNIPQQSTIEGAPVWVLEFGNDIDTGTADGCRLVIQSSQYQERTTDAAGVSNYNSPFSRIDLGTSATQDYDFQLELPAGITAGGFTTADPNYLTQVVYPIFIAMANATDDGTPTGNRLYDWPRAGQIGIPPALAGITPAPNAPMSIHLTSTNNAIAIEFEQFESGGDSRVRIGERFVYDPGTLTAEGTALPGSLKFENGTRTVADMAGVTTHLDFDNELVDRSDSWFFFDPPLPSGAVVFVDPNPQGTGMAFGDEVDGGDDRTSGTDMDGGSRLAGDVDSGNRRVGRNFSTIVTEPIMGLGPGEHIFQIWVPGTDSSILPLPYDSGTGTRLVAYNPKDPRLDGNLGGSFATNDPAIVAFDIDDIGSLPMPPPVLNFRMNLQRCSGQGWVEEDRPLIERHAEVNAILATTVTADQNRIFARVIANAFTRDADSYLTPDLSMDDQSNIDGGIEDHGNNRFTIHLVSTIDAAVHFQFVDISNNPTGDAMISDADVTFNGTTQQGYFQFVNRLVSDAEQTDILRPMRQFESPSILLQHALPGGRRRARLLDFTRVIPLVPASYRGMVDPYPVADILQNIIDHVVGTDSVAGATTPAHWEGTDISIANRNELEFTTVPFTQPATAADSYADGMQVPAERLAGEFTITVANIGCAVPFDEGDTPPFATGNQATGIDQVRNIPSYAVFRVANSSILEGPNGQPAGEEVIILEYGEGLDDHGNAEAVSLKWIQDLERVAPRLNVVDSGTGSFSVHPANYTDLANFVQEFVINSPDIPDPEARNLSRIRELLDSNLYTQHRLNFRPYGTLARRLDGTGVPDNLNADNANGESLRQSYYLDTATNRIPEDPATLRATSRIVIEFDVDRPWPKTQVNFTREFPIFASTLLHPSGNSTSKILGADIGWSRPAYVDEGVRVESPHPMASTTLVITGQDAPTVYESFVERMQLGLTPEFNVEMLSSIAAWGDGLTELFFQGPVSRNRLEFQIATSNAPGELFNAEGVGFRNVFFISEDYKIDVRLTGRFINYRISDAIDGTELDQYAIDIQDPVASRLVNDKRFNQKSEWRLSGLQLNVDVAGTR